jgi:hypothetical protein
VSGHLCYALHLRVAASLGGSISEPTARIVRPPVTLQPYLSPLPSNHRFGHATDNLSICGGRHTQKRRSFRFHHLAHWGCCRAPIAQMVRCCGSLMPLSHASLCPSLEVDGGGVSTPLPQADAAATRRAPSPPLSHWGRRDGWRQRGSVVLLILYSLYSPIMCTNQHFSLFFILIPSTWQFGVLGEEVLKQDSPPESPQLHPCFKFQLLKS